MKKESKSGLWGLAIKVGSVLLKAIKGFKYLKLGLGLATFASYSVLVTWKFALLVLIGIGFHESGHVFMMRKLGFRTKGFYFLPFLGGVAVQQDNYNTYWENVRVSLAGPFFGLLLATVTYITYLITRYPILGAATGWMCLVNIFNLFPINPLDGGQVLKAIAVSLGRKAAKIIMVASFVFGFCVMIYFKFFLLAVVLAASLADLSLMLRPVKPYLWSGHNEVIEHPDYLNKDELKLSVLMYVALVTCLGLLQYAVSHIPGADIASNFYKS